MSHASNPYALSRPGAPRPAAQSYSGAAQSYSGAPRPTAHRRSGAAEFDDPGEQFRAMAMQEMNRSSRGAAPSNRNRHPVEPFAAMSLTPSQPARSAPDSSGDGGAGAHPSRGKIDVSQFRAADADLPDTHELLKEQMFGGYPPACNDHANKSTPCPDAPHGFSDQYALLDSPYKRIAGGASGSDTTVGRYAFDIATQDQTQPGSIGVHDTLTNVVAVEIEPFYIPGPQLLPVGPDPVPTAAQQPLTPQQQTEAAQAFLYRRFRLNLLSTGEQSVRLGGGGRSNIEFHATLETLATGQQRYLLEPVLRQAYTFTQPLTSLNTLSVQLRSQNNRGVPLAPDTYANVIVTPGSPVTFSVAPTAASHGLATGDLVHFLGWTSTSAALNNALTNERHARVVPTTVTEFTLESQDSAGVYQPVNDPAPFTVTSDRTLVLPWRRIQIPIRIRTVRDRTTNYI